MGNMEKSFIMDDKQIVFKDRLADRANMIREKSRKAYNKIIDSKAKDVFALDKDSYLYIPKRPLSAPIITTAVEVFRAAACTSHVYEDLDWSKILKVLIKHYDVFQPGLMFSPLYRLDNPGWVIWKPV